MFCSTTMMLGVLLGTALQSPPTDAGPELRGPRWQGRASATAQLESATDLRDPWRGGRGGIAAEQSGDDGSLRDPFEGRGGVAVRRVDDQPIAPASRPRSRAPVPTPAATSSDTELRRPFGAA